MPQSIHVKTLPATNSRGRRVKARTASGVSLTRGWDYAIDADANYAAVAQELAESLNWRGIWVGGSFGPHGEETVFVSTGANANTFGAGPERERTE